MNHKTLAARNLEYVHAARTIGCSASRVMLRHVLPNVIGPGLVYVFTGMVLAILTGATLSYLGLGPQPPDCLYSVFLAKLVTIRNTLRKHGGQLVLCELSPVAYSVFEACLLHREFTFAPDYDAAVTLMSPPDVK